MDLELEKKLAQLRQLEQFSQKLKDKGIDLNELQKETEPPPEDNQIPEVQPELEVNV